MHSASWDGRQEERSTANQRECQGMIVMYTLTRPEDYVCCIHLQLLLLKIHAFFSQQVANKTSSVSQANLLSSFYWIKI